MMGTGKHYAAAIDRICKDVLAQLQELPNATLNQSVPLEEANSLFALATHLISSTEFWVVQTATGRDVGRNRPAEFHASGTYADLAARFAQVQSDVHAALDDIDEQTLDGPPASEAARTAGWWGGSWPLTVRDCVLHAVEHAALHLGHIQITRQVLTEGPYVTRHAGGVNRDA